MIFWKANPSIFLHSAITALNQHTCEHFIVLFSHCLSGLKIYNCKMASESESKRGHDIHVNNDLKFELSYSSSNFIKLIQVKYTVRYNMCRNLKLIFPYSHHTTMFGSAVILLEEIRCF